MESPAALISRKRVVQIAGVASTDEAHMLAGCGVDFIGFPLRRSLLENDAKEDDVGAIIRSLRPPIFGVLITYESRADAVCKLCRALGVGAVQLHGAIEVDEVQRIKLLSPGLFVVKALVVREGGESRIIDEADRFVEYVDAFLTDTFDSSTGRRGATGKTHDWAVSRRVVERSVRPVILAGGLTPENVYRAIADVRPAGVDAHTGVEDADGRKDRALVERFVSQARKAFESIS